MKENLVLASGGDVRKAAWRKERHWNWGGVESKGGERSFKGLTESGTQTQ